MAVKSNGIKFWIVWGSVLALVCAAGTWALAQYLAQRQLDQTAERFSLLNSLRKQALQEYFKTAHTELTFWSLNVDLHRKQAELVKVWQTNGNEQGAPGDRLRALYINRNPHPHGERRELADAGDGSLYSAVHAELHPLAKRFVTERNYYDFFLIGPDGNILYTVEKEDDFGTSLKTGPWRDTGLADVYRRALARNDSVVISDLDTYGPSANAPAIFMARAMVSADGELLGVLAFQLPTDSIQAIMQFDAGMGDSGETYLVGMDGLMRSDSRFSSEPSTLKVAVNTEAVQRALADEQGVMIGPDYRGVMVLSAYDSLHLDGFQWAILAEIDHDEIFRNAARSYPEIAGLMALVYALALGSLWFMRPGEYGIDGTVADAGSPGMDSPDLPG